MYKFHCFQDHYTLLKLKCTEKIVRKKFGMAKNGLFQTYSETIFPKKTGTNSEWPKMAIPNFFLAIFPNKTDTNSE